LTNAGLDPAAFDIIVAKGVHGPLGALKDVCRTFIKVDTQGTTSANPSSFPFRHRRRPMYPLERDISVDWEATFLSRNS
jgi:microcystin degradation protein MlrC